MALDYIDMSQVQERTDLRYGKPTIEHPFPRITEAHEPKVKPTLDWVMSPNAFPWKESISGLADDQLHYMPFVEWQLEHIMGLNGVKPMAMHSHMAYKQSEKKNTRIGE